VALDGAALTEAAGRLLTRGTATGDVDRVRRAVALSGSVLVATCPGSANHTGASANAARALIAEYEMTRRAGALDRAMSLLESAEPDSGLLGDRGADFFAILGHALLRDVERTGLPAAARRAVAARRKARELTSREDSAYPGRLADLGAVLAVQFRVTGDPAALREAVRVYEAAVGKLDPEDPVLPGLLSNLGTCLDELAMRDGGIPLLERAVSVQRDALDAAAPSDPLQPMISANLGVTLLRLHRETGARGALGESIKLHRAAAAKTSEAHVDYQPRRTNLAVALLTLYEETGDLDALDEAIEIFRQAVDRTPPEHANWFKYQHDLTSALMRLAQRNGDLSAIDEAIQTWQEAVGGTSTSSTQWSRPIRIDVCSMFARMPRYGPAQPGTRSATRMRATGQNGSSRHVLALFNSSSRRINEQSSGLLIRGFGVQVPGGAPVLTWGFTTPGLSFDVRFVPMFAPYLLGRTGPAIGGLSKTARPAPDPGTGAPRIGPLPPPDTDMSSLDHWSRPSLAKAGSGLEHLFRCRHAT